MSIKLAILVQGLVNIEKNKHVALGVARVRAVPFEGGREHYVVQNDLDLLPESSDRFLKFYAARRERIERRLRNLLGVTVDERDVVAS